MPTYNTDNPGFSDIPMYGPVYLLNGCQILLRSFLFFCNRGDTTYRGTTPDKGVWPSPYTVAGVIISPTRLYYDFV